MYLNCFIVTVMYVFGLLLQLPAFLLWNVLVVALGSDVDFAILLGLLSCFLAPRACDNLIYTVSSFGQVERYIGECS